MTRIEIEDLLWELSRLEEAPRQAKPADGAIPDGLLVAYRAGRLSPDQARRVEHLLARDLEARQRLQSLSEIHPPPLSARARQRFLRAREAPARMLPAVGSFAGRPSRWLLAAAAILLTVTGGFYLVLREPTVAPIPIPEVDVSIQGLSEVRGEGGVPGARFATAEPDTAITVGVSVDPPRAGLAVGLYAYRSRTGAVVRLPVEPKWKTRQQALLQAPAESLVGDRPGTYRLFAVIGRDDSMPPDRILRSGEEPEMAFDGFDVKVASLRLEIIRSAAPGVVGGGRDQKETG